MEPFLLRRLKSDVETKIPPKEETVIDVELTGVQKQYYRAIYERNTEFLMKGGKSRNNAPNLMNIVMELRKARDVTSHGRSAPAPSRRLCLL